MSFPAFFQPQELVETFPDFEYDAWLIPINGVQFTSGFHSVNPNSKIPAMMDYSDKDKPVGSGGGGEDTSVRGPELRGRWGTGAPRPNAECSVPALGRAKHSKSMGPSRDQSPPKWLVDRKVRPV